MKYQVKKLGFQTKGKSDKTNCNKSTELISKFSIDDFVISHTLGKGSSAVVKLATHK